MAAGLPAATSLEVVEATVHRALASLAVVSAGDHWAQRTAVHAPSRLVPDDRTSRYTSRSLLDVEARLLVQLQAALVTTAPGVEPGVVETVIARSALDGDQAAAVRALTAGDPQVAVLVGRAGTGKTHTLGTVRAAYEAVGLKVIGLAPSARAARELQAGAAITSVTVARHLVEHRDIDASTVVVVDEAGMAGIRDVAAIIDQATRVGAQVILVGDHHQLPEVAAGGAFCAALEAVGERAVELTVNRRQQHAWERAALDQLRDGDVATAFAAYRAHNRVVVADDQTALHDRVIADWQRLQSKGDTVMLAGTRAEARALNRAARAALGAAGELDLSGEFEIAGQGFAPGDRVVLLHNDPRQHLATGEPFPVDNGMIGTVTAPTPTGLQVRLLSGQDVILDRDYLALGCVDYAYALTVHKVQGVTCDFVLVVGPAGLYREALYVALSRARQAAWLYATGAQLDAVEHHDTGIPPNPEIIGDAEDELIAQMRRSAAKTLVSLTDIDIARVEDLTTSMTAAELLAHARAALDAEAAVEIADPAELRTGYDKAVAARNHLAEGRRVRALDLDNVGTVTAVDDIAGTCEVHFVNERGAQATRTMRWSELVVIDDPEPVALTREAERTLARHADQVADAEIDWTIELAAHGVEPGDADRCRRAVHVAIDRAAHALRSEQPDWLLTWLGPRPTDPAGAAVWDDATTRIAHHRTLHDIDRCTAGLGPCPTGADTATRWRQLMLRVLEDRCWLDQHRQPQPHSTIPARQPAELHARRTEVLTIVAGAPPDQQGFIDRLSRGDLDNAEIHERLLAAAKAQDERRAWIVANWPHVVELEQLNRIIANLPAFAHWPVAESPAVQHVLDELRLLAPTPHHREERTLVEIDRQQVAKDPVMRLEARRNHLQHLRATAGGPTLDALQRELADIGVSLHKARRQQTIDQVFARYVPDAAETARQHRRLTVAHDVLTEPPDWVLDALRRVDADGQLARIKPEHIATRIVSAATHLDRHGQLPPHWDTHPIVAPTRDVPRPQPALPER